VGKFQSIQSLRFFAAALVLCSHLEIRLSHFSQRYHTPFHYIGFSGHFGVDIFFVISGFIMTWLSFEKFGKSGAPSQFALDRLTRIVPLYWIFTTVGLGYLVLAMHFGDPAQLVVPSGAEVAKSYFLVPYFNQDGKHFPVLGVGWTLDYEMLFYAILTGCLLLKRTAGLIALFVLFGLIFAAGHIPGAPEFLRIWSNPIIFEFLAGVVLALIRIRFGVLIPFRAHPLILLAPIILLTILGDDARGPWEWANFPVGFVLVAFAVLGLDQRDGVLSRAIATMGDWSYSLYLLHEFVVMAVGSVWHRAFGGHALYALGVVTIAIALACSCASFIYLERPITRSLRARVGVQSLRKAAPAAD
jgi:exopolysaccharide production protein ExoZ